MNMICGKVGEIKFEWLSIPFGPSGTVSVRVNGELLNVRWSKDDQGIWIQTPEGTFGFDAQVRLDDQGVQTFDIRERGGDRVALGIDFVREGEEQWLASGGQRKKSLRVKAQMPGKIVSVGVAPGDVVEAGTPLLIMEAMKMENQITAPQAGTVKSVDVEQGQAVESGTLLVSIGAE